MNWKAVGYCIAFFFLAILVFSVLSQPLFHQSWGLNIVQGPSMEPVFHSGDMVFVVPYATWLQGQPRVGEIIVFEAWADEGFRQMMIHRIHEIKNGGILTKGDNVAMTDQEGGAWKPLSEEDIQGMIPEIAGYPLMIPYLGELIDAYWLYLVIGVSALLIILYINGLEKPRKWKKILEERRKRTSFYHHHESEITYSALFLIFTIFLMWLLSSGWQSGYITYDVSETRNSEAFGSRGSNLGVLQVGTEKSITMNFSNALPIPTVTVIISDDPNIIISENPLVISSNDVRKTNLTVIATKENIGRNYIKMDYVTYPGLLPVDIITSLSRINIPLAMFCLACFPVGIITIVGYEIDRTLDRRKL